MVLMASPVQGLVPPAGLAEVEAAEELADEEDVDAFCDFGPERGIFAEGGVGDRGAQVGEAAEDLADLEEAGLGGACRGRGG